MYRSKTHQTKCKKKNNSGIFKKKPIKAKQNNQRNKLKADIITEGTKMVCRVAQI